MLQRGLSPAFCLALLAGCTYSPFFLVQESSLKRALPSDVSMTDYVEKDLFGNKVTVAEKLARLGAYTEGDKIRDGTGQEIRFIKHEERSLKASPELLKQELDKMRDLKRYFTVIEVQRDPGPASAVPATAPSALAGTGKPADVPPPAAWPPDAAQTNPVVKKENGVAAPTSSAGWQPATPPATAPAAAPPATNAPVAPQASASAPGGWQPAK